RRQRVACEPAAGDAQSQEDGRRRGKADRTGTRPATLGNAMDVEPGRNGLLGYMAVEFADRPVLPLPGLDGFGRLGIGRQISFDLGAAVLVEHAVDIGEQVGFMDLGAAAAHLTLLSRGASESASRLSAARARPMRDIS